MEYHIQIASGVKPGTSVRFSEDVFRIGHGEKCEIRIPTKAAHALTIFRRAETVFVLNRTKSPILSAEALWQVVQPSNGDQTLLLTLMEFNCNCSTQSRQPVSEMHSAKREPLSLVSNPEAAVRSPAPGSSFAANQKKSRTLQVAIIAVCLATIAIMQGLGTGITSRGDAFNEQLSTLSKDLNGIAKSTNVNKDSKMRVQSMLQLLSQYQIAELVEEKRDAEIVRADFRSFCMSIAESKSVSSEERKLAARLVVVLAQIE